MPKFGSARSAENGPKYVGYSWLIYKGKIPNVLARQKKWTDNFLIFLGLPTAFLFLILVTPVVSDPTNGRLCRRRNFHKIEPSLPCDDEGLLRRHYTELFPFIISNPNLSDPNTFVNPRAGRTKIPPLSSSKSDGFLPSLCVRSAKFVFSLTYLTNFSVSQL